MSDKSGKNEESEPLLQNDNADITVVPSEEFTSVSTPTKNFVLPIGMFLYAIGQQLGSTAIQQYTYNYTSTDDGYQNSSSFLLNSNASSATSCGINKTSSQNQNEKESANLLLVFETIEYSIGIPVIIIAGIYSDFYGRKFFLLLSTLGSAIYMFLISLVVFFDFPISYFNVAYGVYGITGTHYTFYLAASTLIADTTRAGKTRSFHITLVYAYIGTGLTLASLGSGYLIHYTGFALPLAVSAGTCFIAAFVLSFQKETLSEKIRAKKPPFFQTFLRSFGFFCQKGYASGAKQWKFLLVFSAFIFCLCPLTTIISITTLYQLGEPFCFSSEMIGYFQAATDFSHLVVGTIVLKGLFFCFNNESVIILGLVSGISYFIIMASSTTVLMVCIGTGCGLLYIIPTSLFRGLMSGMTSPQHQGALFSLTYLSEALGRLSGNAIFMSIYGHTQDFMKGFVFIVMAGFYVISGLLFIPVAVHNWMHREVHVTETEYVINASDNKE